MMSSFFRAKLGVVPKGDSLVELKDSFKPFITFDLKGYRILLISKICNNLNQDIGYNLHRITIAEEIYFLIQALPFRIGDIITRALSVFTMKRR